MIMKEGNQTMFQFFRRRLRNERGFTLIELLIVVAIIAILAAILIPNFLRARAQSQGAATQSNLKHTPTPLESYFVDNAAYPQPPLGNTNLLPSYARALPPDPCSGTAFGTSQRETEAVPSNPTTEYTLSTNCTVAGEGAACFAAASPPNGSNIQYTPGGG